MERKNYPTPQEANLQLLPPTINLLAQISFGNKPLLLSQIIENRTGAYYPKQTVEEIEQLVKLGLIEIDDQERFFPTEFGKAYLHTEGILPRDYIEKIIEKILTDLQSNETCLPPESYAYEEFRFTPETVAKLLKKIYQEYAYRRLNIVCLGAPMVGFFLSHPEAQKITNSVMVLDINSNLIDSIIKQNRNPNLVAVEFDATQDKIPDPLREKFQAVISDPPWHNEYYAAFADIAWSLLKKDGRVYFSTFAPETRPEATEELNDLYKIFINGGYSIIEITPEYFGYWVPAFEVSIFEQSGLKISTRGNYGQLVIIQKNSDRKNGCLTENLKQKLSMETPCSFHLCGKTINLWLPPKSDDQGVVITLIDETHLSTSRSARRQKGINMLVGRKAYYVKGSHLIRVILDIINKHQGQDLSPTFILSQLIKNGIQTVTEENIQQILSILYEQS